MENALARQGRGDLCDQPQHDALDGMADGAPADREQFCGFQHDERHGQRRKEGIGRQATDRIAALAEWRQLGSA
jgi:hypothetical protein